MNMATYAYDFIKVADRINPQYLDRNLAILVFTLPYVGIPAAIQRVIRLIEAKWDLECCRKESLGTA